MVKKIIKLIQFFIDSKSKRFRISRTKTKYIDCNFNKIGAKKWVSSAD